MRAWLPDRRREEDINALIAGLNGCSGSMVPFASDSVLTPRQDLVTARVRGASRSVTSDVRDPGTAAFVKLLRDRGVYDIRATAGSAWPVFDQCRESRCR